MKNVIQEKQEEKTAMDETIKKLKEEKHTQAQKVVDLEQKVKGVLLKTAQLSFSG